MPTDKEFTGVTDIPEPFKIKSIGDVFSKFLTGSAIVVLSIGLGTGEVISGPYGVLKFGPGILWFALISILLQTISSIAATRLSLIHI